MKISFIVPKTVSKSAVVRNLLKRRGYACIRKNISFLPHSFWGAFIFGKKSVLFFGSKKRKNNPSVKNLDFEIKNILEKVNRNIQYKE